MVNRLLIGFLAVTIVGGALLGFGYKVIRDHNQRNAEIQSRKKADIAVTIIEGRRREEIAAELANLGITGYQEFLKASEPYEGQLFPDTYRFYANTPASEVVAKLRATYALKVGTSVTSSQLILASIIEREAQNAAERPLISGVYTNRLARGMDLEADPTVQYGKDTLAYAQSSTPQTFKFWSKITQADYQSVNSPFNTYRVSGLPPAPICNPGKSSIEAALNPSVHEYLFFAHRNNELLMGKTLAEHLLNLQK